METRHFQGSWLCVGYWPAPVRSSLVRLTLPPPPRLGSLFTSRSCSRRLRVANCTGAAASTPGEQELVLPEKLRNIVSLFAAVPDQRARYEQLMHYAKRLPPLPDEYHTDENRVVGCVSRVWVRAYLHDDNKVVYDADSDSILTKGLAALLVEGLSGSSPSEIVRLTPDFFHLLGLQQSLTPARTSGFYNMFRLMQKKALELDSGLSKPLVAAAVAAASRAMAASKESDGWSPTAATTPGELNADKSPSTSSRSVVIQRKLQEALSPTALEVEDVSYQHAGHAAVRGSSGGETHFNVKIVSAEFEGQSIVKRHRRVYQLLDEELKAGLHALSIVAKAPSELKS